jgi:hypothetical protein
MTAKNHRAAPEAAGRGVVPSPSEAAVVTSEVETGDRIGGIDPGDGEQQEVSASEMVTEGKAVQIQALNDAFRRSLRGGRVVTTRGVAALGAEHVVRLLARVQAFDIFTADNDPWGEHDFGAFELEGERFFWKIDSYDRTMALGSADPADPDRTHRVLTVMLAEEY